MELADGELFGRNFQSSEKIARRPRPGFLRHVIVPTLILIALCFAVGALCIAMFEKKDDTVLRMCWRVGSIVVPAGFALLFLRWAGRRGIAGSIGGFAWRFLGPRSWAWPLAALLLVPAANHVPRPGDLPMPRDAAEIFQPITLITPEGDSFRFIAFEEWHKFKPVYAVTMTTMARQEVTLTPGWDAGKVIAGFFHRSARWSYELTGTRFEWKGSDDGPIELAPGERKKLRPLVVAELNRRAFGRGRLLEDMLDNGRREESFVCWQNLVTLLAWLSLPLAAVALLLRLWPVLFRKK